MKILKNGLFLLFAISLLGFSACKKDDCTAPLVEENIIGTWEESFSDDEVEFKADGTLIDENGALFEVESNGVIYSDKSYTIANDVLTITVADPANASAFASADFDIIQNECDEIKLEVNFLGTVVTTTLERK